jgi:hypothetical protein
MFPAGEGFTLKVSTRRLGLKVLPEGTGVRLSHTNQMQTEPIKLFINIFCGIIKLIKELVCLRNRTGNAIA